MKTTSAWSTLSLAGLAVVPTTAASTVAWVFDGDLLDHVDAEEVKSAMHAYKNRMDKEFAALADACDAEM